MNEKYHLSIVAKGSPLLFILAMSYIAIFDSEPAAIMLQIQNNKR